MKLLNTAAILLLISFLESCQPAHEVAKTVYAEVVEDSSEPFYAVSDGASLEYGANVAYVDSKGDTLIGFGKYAYFGTDTLLTFAFVLPIQSPGKPIAINRNGEIIFDVVLFDNGPDLLNDGLMRIGRNGKMGFANAEGRIVIQCIYEFAKPFENGVAEVSLLPVTYRNQGEHQLVESDEWIQIYKLGNRATE